MILVGFGRACAPVRCAHPSFLTHCHLKRGAARPSPPIAASYSALKNIYNLSNLGRSREGFFSVHWTAEAMRSPAPVPPIAASLILPAMFWGQKYIPVRPYALIFRLFFSLVVGSFPFVILFFAYLLFNFFLFFSSYLFLFFL